MISVYNKYKFFPQIFSSSGNLQGNTGSFNYVEQISDATKTFLKTWVRVTSDCLLCLIISNYSVYTFLVFSIAGHADFENNYLHSFKIAILLCPYNIQLCLITKLGKSCIIACLFLLKWTQFSSLKILLKDIGRNKNSFKNY